MRDLDRGGFLRLGAGGFVGAAATGLVAPVAGAQPPLAPQDDDVAYLSFATAAESVSRDFYRAAFKQAGTGLSAAQRRHINRVAAAKRAHIIRLKAALGGDAPQSADFATVLPKGAVKTTARIAALGAQLETLLVRVYLNGVGFAADSATRLFLGRLLAYDAEQLAWLRGVSGHNAPGGLLSPIDLEPAAEALDAFLSTQTSRTDPEKEPFDETTHDGRPPHPCSARDRARARPGRARRRQCARRLRGVLAA